jgi:hypothetical protein
LNLLEIGTVGILAAMGVNSHEFLRALLNSGSKHKLNKQPLIEHFRAQNFSQLLLLPGIRNYEIEDGNEQDRPLSPVWYGRNLGEMEKMFSVLSTNLGIPAWIVVNFNVLKQFVDKRLREL